MEFSWNCIVLLWSYKHLNFSGSNSLGNWPLKNRDFRILSHFFTAYTSFKLLCCGKSWKYFRRAWEVKKKLNFCFPLLIFGVTVCFKAAMKAIQLFRIQCTAWFRKGTPQNFITVRDASPLLKRKSKTFSFSIQTAATKCPTFCSILCFETPWKHFEDQH